MLSLIQTVVGFIWKGDVGGGKSIEEDDLNPEELPNLISFLKSDDSNSKTNDTATGINIVNGNVTHISGDYCLINDQYYLDLRKFSFSHVLEVGTHLAFSVFRLSEDEEWQINRVYSIGEETWDQDDDNHGLGLHLQEEEGAVMCLDEAENKGLAQRRTVIGKVLQREGRNVVIDPGDIRFSLDEVESSIVPLNGDWLSLETLVKLDQKSGDLGGDVLKVVKVSALRVRLVENGEVTQSENAFAVVNNNILALKLSCCPGYEPRVGDRVVLQAIESDCGNGCSWRTIALAPADASKQKFTVAAENIESEEDSFLVKDKEGIFVRGDCDFGNMTLRSEGLIVLYVSNEGPRKQLLIRSKFNIARSQSQMELVQSELVGNEGILFPSHKAMPIHPGEVISFTFQCKPRFLGNSSELFVFTFRGFRIGRYLKVRVIDALSNSAPGICERPGRDLYQMTGNSLRWQRHQKPQRTDGMIVPGVLPLKPPAFTSMKLPLYDVPDRLWDAVVDANTPQGNRKNFSTVLTDIKEAIPALKYDSHLGLSPKTYKQSLHALLHLEEIEISLKIQERDLFGVTMHPVGPGGQFLALEVPGLAEARPSIMIGDRVLLTSNNNKYMNQMTKYEGYVHRITKSEVWLKFNLSFHEKFKKVECGVIEKAGEITEIIAPPELLWDVSFHFSRTPLRRCHLAIDLALTHLGEDFIFPKKITIKKPQIFLSECYEKKIEKNLKTHKVYREEEKDLLEKRKNGEVEETGKTVMMAKKHQELKSGVMNGKSQSEEDILDGNSSKSRERTDFSSMREEIDYKIKTDDVNNDICNLSNSSEASSCNSTQRIPVIQRLFGASSPPQKSIPQDKEWSISVGDQVIEASNGVEHGNCRFDEKHLPSIVTPDHPSEDTREVFVPTHQKRTVKWFNQRLNKQQKSAVLNILKGEARPLPYVIFGPPGTGKTVTLVEAILQILHLVPESRIIVATPSNSSADLIAERVLELVPLNPGELVRLIALHCLEDGKIPSCLMPYCTTGVFGRTENDDENLNILDPGKRIRIPMSSASLGRHRITIGTCVALGQLHALGLPKGHFTHVFLDEAGQSTEPEALIPLGFLSTSAEIGWGQAILAGDPRQLGPVVISKFASHLGLSQSLLARILLTSPYAPDPVGFPDKTASHLNPNVVTRLVVNYRSVPKLLSLTSELFYDGSLLPTVSPYYSREGQLLLRLAKHLPLMKCSEELKDVEIASPLVFHGVRGEESRLMDSPSWFNPMEAVQCLEYIKILYHLAELNPCDIGIITPYVEQVKTIRNLIGDNCLPLPKVGTVEEFQGQERLVILLSCVRTSQSQIPIDLLYALGFVSSANRLNVATSRARALLIIVGDPHLLQHDPLWNKIIVRCIESESYIGCDLPNSFLKCVDQSEEIDLSEEICPDN